MAPLYKLVLFNRPDGSPVAFYQYRASARLGSLDAAARQERIAAGAIPFEDVEKEARTIGRFSMAKLRADAREALEAWEAMATILDEKAGADSPSTSQVRDLIREIAEIAMRYAPEEVADAEAEDEGSDGPAAETGSGGSGSVRLTGVAERAVTREDALRSLESIAEFFRKTEPHSPLSFTLDEAVRRARMPWLDLLDEVIGDRSTRDSILTALGIRPPPPPDE